MKILLFDNYDSFTYNLLHILKELGADVEVHRNDKISLEEIERFDKILLSPGPGIPEEAGILLPLIRRYAPTKSILGVCLGEQAIGEAFGATLINLTDVHHGVCSDIRIVAKDPIFEGLEPGIRVGRYHSWAVSRKTSRIVWKLRRSIRKKDRSWACAIVSTMYEVSNSIRNPC